MLCKFTPAALLILSLTGASAISLPVLPRQAAATPQQNQSISSGNWTWSDTTHVFSFGDSYTATNYDGIFAPDSGYSTTSGGGTWITYLTKTYNASSLFTYNFAWGGATIDTDLVHQRLAPTQSFKQQVNSFTTYFSPQSSNITWDPETTLFSIFIGINDVVKTFTYTNVSLPEFYHTEQNEMFDLISNMTDLGAKNFLFLTVPGGDRTPLYVDQNATTLDAYRSALDSWNSQLINRTDALSSSVQSSGGSVRVYDTRPFFDTILDNAELLGFYNSTGYAEPYSEWTLDNHTASGENVQIEPYAPVGSYVWTNNFHPTFPVHDLLGHAVSTFLAK